MNDTEKPPITGPIHKVKRSRDEEATGLTIEFGIHVENGMLVLDFGKPIQYLGLTIDDAKGAIMGMMAATQLAMEDQAPPPGKQH